MPGRRRCRIRIQAPIGRRIRPGRKRCADAIRAPARAIWGTRRIRSGSRFSGAAAIANPSAVEKAERARPGGGDQVCRLCAFLMGRCAVALSASSIWMKGRARIRHRDVRRTGGVPAVRGPPPAPGRARPGPPRRGGNKEAIRKAGNFGPRIGLAPVTGARRSDQAFDLTGNSALERQKKRAQKILHKKGLTAPGGPLYNPAHRDGRRSCRGGRGPGDGGSWRSGSAGWW